MDFDVRGGGSEFLLKSFTRRLSQSKSECCIERGLYSSGGLNSSEPNSMI